MSVSTKRTVIVLLLAPALASAQDGAEDIAKQLSNPVADLVSVPFQFNWEEGVGFEDATRMVLNVQPVVPFTLNDDWNLIARWIMPFVSQPALAPGLESSYGLSDIVFSTFFSPSNPRALTWGVGPVLGLPATDDPTLGSGKWTAGPTVVLLKQQGPWTYGLLANHLWSIADTSDADRPDVSKTFLQPFLSYTTPSAISYALNTEATYDHEAADGDEWTRADQRVDQQGHAVRPFSVLDSGGLRLLRRCAVDRPGTEAARRALR